MRTRPKKKPNISIVLKIKVFDLNGNPNEIYRTLDHEDMPDSVIDIVYDAVVDYLVMERKEIEEFLAQEETA